MKQKKMPKTMSFTITVILFVFILFSFVNIGVSPYVDPTFSNPYPTDDMVNVDVMQSTVNITIYHPYDPFNWTIEGTYITNTGANGESNGSKIANTITPLPYNTKIMWYVNVTHSHSPEIPQANRTYNFTTIVSGKLRINPELNAIEQSIIGVVGIVILLGFLYIVFKTDMKKEGQLAKILVGILLALALLTVIFSAL